MVPESTRSGFTRVITRGLLLTVAVGLLLCARPGLGQISNHPWGLPEVILVVEDGFTWETHYETGAAVNCGLCAGVEPLDCKTDGIALKEVLTGTFDTQQFTCDYRLNPASRPDVGLWPSHVLPTDLTQSNGDGILDRYADSLKFGVFTMDRDAGVENTILGEWSYSGPESCVWDDGGGLMTHTFNLGVKDHNASYGARVAIEPTDSAAAVSASNVAAQGSLRSNITWGSFPAAAALDDVHAYVTFEPHFEPFDGATGDPYYNCRNRAVVLISQGEGDDTYVGGGAGCLDSAVSKANDIYQDTGIPVHAVTYKASSAAMAEAQGIALAGGTSQAVHTSSPNDLRVRLNEIIGSLSVFGASLVRPVSTTITQSPEDVLYEFYAGYYRTASLWDPVGLLFNLIFRCDESCDPSVSGQGAEACDLVDLGAILRDRPDAGRTVLTMEDGVFLEFDEAHIDGNFLDLPTSGTLYDLEPVDYGGGYTYWTPGVVLGDASDNVVREAYADQLVAFIRGDETSRRAETPLGAIYRAQPTVIGEPRLNLSAPGYGAFRLEDGSEPGERLIDGRPTMLYAQDHAGVLHAFRVDRPSDMLWNEYGEELWAYVPDLVREDIKNLPYAASFDFLLDGPLVVRDVLLERNPDMSDEEIVAAWRTVLIGTTGDAGRGIYALDVTEPDDPRFMWEIKPGQRCYSNDDENTGCTPTSTYNRLGGTISQPVIGSLYLSNALGYVGNQERAVLIFGGGTDAGMPGSDVGKNVFVVDLKTGQRLKEFTPSDPAVQEPLLFDAPVTGSPAAYNTFPGRLVTKAFLGDEGGRLWRLDVSSPVISNWTMELFYDVSDATGGVVTQPIRQRPTLATDTNWGGLVVVFNTGGPGAVADATVQHAVMSVREAFSYSGSTPTLAPETLWEHVFTAGEIPTTAPIVYNRVAYFATYVSDAADACNMGDGRVYGVSYNEADSGDDFVGVLDHPDAATDEYFEYPDQLIIGLQIVYLPSCTGEVPTDYAWQQGGDAPTADQVVSGTPTIVGSTGVGGTMSPGQTPPTTPSTPSVGSVSVPVSGSPRNLIYSSWGVIFE
jgi:hypothetical protein